jgi:DNA-binding XRE family transcriptional regulator
MIGVMDNWSDELKPVMIRQGRKKMGLDQIAFAETMGCSGNTVCQWETGRRTPKGSAWRMFLILMSHHGIEFSDDGIVKDVKRSPMLDTTKKKKKAA